MRAKFKIKTLFETYLEVVGDAYMGDKGFSLTTSINCALAELAEESVVISNNIMTCQLIKYPEELIQFKKVDPDTPYSVKYLN
jgi:hypothetical protein